MKKILSAILCAAMVLSLTACDNQKVSIDTSKSEPTSISSSKTTSEPVYTYSEADFEYDTAEGGIKITKYLGKGGYVKIPDKIDGKTVVEINSDAFDGCVGLIGIFIPAKLTNISIGGSYLEGCINLESIKVADDNPNYYSFDDVLYAKEEEGLTMMVCPIAKKGILKIPSSVTALRYGFGNISLYECEYIEGINVADGNPNFCSIDGLLCEKEDNGDITLVVYPKAKGSEIVIPDGVTIVDSDIFDERSDITIYIGSDVRHFNFSVNGSMYIGAPEILHRGAFAPFDITKIKNISVSENNKTFFCIDKMLCENSEDGEVELLVCLPTASRKIAIPDGVTYIGRTSFKDCKDLTGIAIPNSVRTIGVDAFRGCSKLKSIDIPESVSVIGWEAFEGCENLSSVAIPDSVTYIGKDAFKGCNNIKVTYKGKTYTQSNMSDFYNLFSNTQPSDTSSATNEPTAYSPETDFGAAFVNDGMEIRTYVGNGGDVVIPETISGDPVVMISGRITNHEGFVGAFKNNTAVTSITIPDTVMGFGGVEGCTNLKSINVGEGNPYLASIDGILYRKTENGLMLILCPEGKKGKIVIPDSVTEIAEGAFYGCNRITEIVVGNGVTKVNKDILGGCVNLKHLTLGNGINRFGHPPLVTEGDTLENFESLETVVFGDGLTWLGDGFDGCTNLKKVVLGKNLETIDRYAFAGCSSLNEIDIPKSVTRIDEGAFTGTAWLENKRKENPLVVVNGILIDGTACSGNVTIPNGITDIGYKAFAGCKNITNVTVPNGVTHIWGGAFSECANLKKVTLPNSITFVDCPVTMGYPVFYESPNVTVTYKGKTYTQNNMFGLYGLFNELY